MASLLESELDKLKNAIIKIGNLAEHQIFEAIKALLSEPVSEAKEMKKTEHKIDKLDLKIDEICQNVFALQQPVASDLRFIMSAMQISNDFERIGDLSINIIKKAKNINEKLDLTTKLNIAIITRDIENNIQKTNECFKSQNEDLIHEIFVLNKKIQKNCEATILNIILEMKSNTKAIVSGTNLVIILKHLERVGDHCTNIAESIYFVVNAESIKHEKFKTD